MTTDNSIDDDERRIDRRTVLQKGAIAAGGLSLVGVGSVAADQPDKYEVDVTGQERYVPCLGETVRITEGTWVVTEDGPEKQGKCLHYNFHFHYKNGVTLEGQDSGRVWTGQGSKNRNFTVCPPYPGQDTLTNRTTATSEDAETSNVVQIKITAHVTVNANGDTTVSFYDVEFSCRGKGAND